MKVDRSFNYINVLRQRFDLIDAWDDILSGAIAAGGEEIRDIEVRRIKGMIQGIDERLKAMNLKNFHLSRKEESAAKHVAALNRAEFSYQDDIEREDSVK